MRGRLLAQRAEPSLTCGQTASFTRMTKTNENRVLVVRYNFTPGFVGLKPAGQSGSEKFFSVRYTVQ